MYFFDVTKSLFNSIIDGLKTVMDKASPIIGSLSVVFLVIITIGLISAKNKKKYIKDNYVMIVSVLIVEGIIGVLFFNRALIKINLLVLVICLFILVLETKPKKRKIKKLVTEEVE